jgi:NADH dehydrogenase
MSQYTFNPQYPTIVVLGGGFAGLRIARKLNGTPYNVLIIDKHNYHTFQPLLYQVATGGLGADAIAYPLRKVIGPMRNVGFRMATVTEIDTQNTQVITNVGNFKYDYLVVAVGATTNYFGNTQIEANSMKLKTIPESLDLRSDILQEFEKALVASNHADKQSALNFVIVGGGPTGVELAGAMAEIKTNVLPADYRELNPDLMNVFLVESGDRLLGSMSENASQAAFKYLTKMGVQIRLKTFVTDYDGTTLFLKDGTTIPCGTMVWSAGVKGITLKGLDKATIVRGNRYQTDAFLKMTGYDNIYAVGDIAAVVTPETPIGLPMLGSVAVQQGEHIANNFARIARQKEARPFKYFDKGSMATIGRNKAVVDLPFLKFSGFVAWLAWMFVHLMLLAGFRNRFVTLLNWAWSYFSYKGAIRLIIRPFVPNHTKKQREDAMAANS